MQVLNMDALQARPGDLVVSNFNGYQHWSIVSDRRCSARKYMLISARRETGTVSEDSWDQVTKGRETYVVHRVEKITVREQLDRARSMKDEWKYGVVTNNCEHFARWASDFEKKSLQVQRGLVGAAAGIALVAQLVENPKPLHLILGAFAGALLGVHSARAKRQDVEFIFADHAEISF